MESLPRKFTIGPSLSHISVGSDDLSSTGIETYLNTEANSSTVRRSQAIREWFSATSVSQRRMASNDSGTFGNLQSKNSFKSRNRNRKTVGGDAKGTENEADSVLNERSVSERELDASKDAASNQAETALVDMVGKEMNIEETADPESKTASNATLGKVASGRAEESLVDLRKRNSDMQDFATRDNSLFKVKDAEPQRPMSVGAKQKKNGIMFNENVKVILFRKKKKKVKPELGNRTESTPAGTVSPAPKDQDGDDPTDDAVDSSEGTMFARNRASSV
eukprot:CAMPEP_0182447554 /NCGR_PEP_ID=MMETSP1172-20130603/17378_1 /TAXON_ID=708627 /ORGANISM="Timspurckia oligopyrenoides, Strain CCMP3278" /LENGTH=277 /DNA_ID=CAMNT_0024644039 /DNA_START=168 /DNA_END=997 /DNA_ORIENTATION=-